MRGMSKHVFKRYGGSYQLHVETFEDLVGALDVPEALWVATACPTVGLALDKKVLELMDEDKNLRVRTEELKVAIRWTAEMLEDTSGIDEASDTIVLAHLSSKAKALDEAARTILDVIAASDGEKSAEKGGEKGAEKKKAKPDTRISLAQIRESDKKLREAGVNGDGIVEPAHIKDEKARAAAEKILGAVSPKKNRGGKDGIDAALLKDFRDKRAKGIERLDKKAAIFVWGDDSPARAKKVAAIEARVDEYFVQCRLVAAQPDASTSLRIPGEKVQGSLGDREALGKAAGALPIAPPNAKGELVWASVARGPYYEAVLALRDDVAVPVLGDAAREVLSEAQFRELASKAKAILEWEAEASDKVLALGEALRAIDPESLDAIQKAIDLDLAQKDRLDAISSLEKLALYQRWILAVGRNFVSMPDLYAPKKTALFEQGELVLAGRLFTLSVLVPDRAAHVAVAEDAHTYLMYVKIDGGGTVPYEVAVPVTAGDASGIAVGKRGVFRNREDKQFDATVVHVVRAPVSLWEAATNPFRRISEFVSTRLRSFGESGDTAVAGAVTAASAAPAATPPPAAASSGSTAGMVAAAGVSIGLIGTALAGLASFFGSLDLDAVAKLFLAVVIVVMVPSGFLGWLKLRKRNVAVLLEGAGWALNDRLLLSFELGALFTRRPPRPAGALVDHTDLAPRVSREDRASSGGGGVVTVFTILVILAIAWLLRAQLASLIAPAIGQDVPEWAANGPTSLNPFEHVDAGADAADAGPPAP